MDTTLAPVLTHGVTCGICDATAPCRANTNIRGLTADSYTGSTILAISAELALPDGWSLRDIGAEVYFTCGNCA